MKVWLKTIESSTGTLNLEYWISICFVLAWLSWSGINAHLLGMWVLEVLPVVLGIIIISRLRRRFPLSLVLQRLLVIFVFLHLIGAHYTYSKVPIGYWLQDIFLLQRNPFDRIAHFFQGFAAAIAFREILIRVLNLSEGKAVFTLSASCALSFSAAYELLEFAAWKLILLRFTQDNILGAQGDIWDTQWDMFMALTGAFIALITLRRAHVASIERVRQTCQGSKLHDNAVIVL
jgi:putative membrane protein